jgi:hypothetical protein
MLYEQVIHVKIVWELQKRTFAIRLLACGSDMYTYFFFCRERKRGGTLNLYPTVLTYFSETPYFEQKLPTQESFGSRCSA